MRGNVRFFILACLVLAGLMLSSEQLKAGLNETVAAKYGPLYDGQPWPLFPFTAYAKTESNVWVHPSSPKLFPSVMEIGDPNADFTTVVIRSPDGALQKTYNSAVLGPCLSSVYSGDFDNDGKPDFVAYKPGSGCGLAGEYGTVVFAFSDGDGYQFTRVTTMGFGPQDLIVDPRTKKFRFIHRSFRSGQCSDGKYHSFWVHRFFCWTGVHFDEDPNLAPIWIQYMERPNHLPTKLLTPALKQKVWSEDPDYETRIEW